MKTPGDRGRSNHREVGLRRLTQPTKVGFAMVAAVSNRQVVFSGQYDSVSASVQPCRRLRRSNTTAITAPAARTMAPPPSKAICCAGRGSTGSAEDRPERGGAPESRGVLVALGPKMAGAGDAVAPVRAAGRSGELAASGCGGVTVAAATEVGLGVGAAALEVGLVVGMAVGVGLIAGAVTFGGG
jgi:hypothetical protein